MSGGVIVTCTKGSDETVDVLCDHCGHAFSAFLHEMADQNAKVVCPNCRARVDCEPAKAVQLAAKQQPVRKPH
jgi:DNA-directed RNA polymerase subunit RPC12/RpoP